MTRVVVVEDHTLVRQSLVKTINAEDGFEVAGEAGRGDEGLVLINQLTPDVVLLDITMPGGNGLE
ncbi:MAG TPA: response regulator transcription factor, partial [Actinomycetota bacterium]|nr:response regulator transcription factor [Actinomycetota bacterium]